MRGDYAMASFLYGQTEYNLLKNSIHLDDYVKKASEYGYKALSITDSNLYAHYKFYNLCKNYKIKPIIGLEINLSLYNKKILAYALDNNGYKNLCRLSTRLMKNTDISYEDFKNDYINCIDETDKERIRFNQKTEEILYNLQKNYKTSIFLFHVSLKNFIKDKIKVTAEISEMNKENENNKYSKIVYEEITNDFILKNATKIFPMNHLEFIPYKPNKTIINPKLSKFNSLLAATTLTAITGTPE